MKYLEVGGNECTFILSNNNNEKSRYHLRRF